MKLSSFFRHYETDFFPIFLNCSSINFRYFATEWMFKKSQSVPLLHFSALCDLPETSKKFRKKIGFFFSIFSLRAFVVSSCRKSCFRFRVFLSLRYGADSGRSRLVDIFLTKEAKNHLRNKPKLYSKAPNTIPVFSAIS